MTTARFGERGRPRVFGHITPSGNVDYVALPPASEPHGLTIGPDRVLWVALETRDLARLG